LELVRVDKCNGLAHFRLSSQTPQNKRVTVVFEREYTIFFEYEDGARPRVVKSRFPVKEPFNEKVGQEE
jgi:hypothetical protein